MKLEDNITINKDELIGDICVDEEKILFKANPDYIYILEKYAFYDGGNIILVSHDYPEVKEYFNQLIKQGISGFGYTIRKYQIGKNYDKKYTYDVGESTDWIEIHENEIRNLKKEWR